MRNFEYRPPRKRIVNVKLTDEEIVTLRKAARRAGAASVSAYLRQIIGIAAAGL